jgi:hypothetical protein
MNKALPVRVFLTGISFPHNGDKSNTINSKSALFHKPWEHLGGLLGGSWHRLDKSEWVSYDCPGHPNPIFPRTDEHFGIPCFSTNTVKNRVNAVAQQNLRRDV